MLSEKPLLILNMIWGQILQEDQMYLQTHITLERQIRIRWWWQTRNVHVAMHLAAGTELIQFYHTTVSIIFIYILITTIVNILTDQLGAGGGGGIFGCLQLPLSMHTEPLLKEKQNILQCSPVYGENSFWRRWWRWCSMFVNSFEKFFRTAAVVERMSTVAQLLYGVFYRGGRVFSR